ncbi:hypothetical protein CL621_01165 [archaeon]|nr:hypothetical protein [archaeon]|tara:strand:+ start:2103 stop:2501 length:399 start_codon:yes stop_codon:yes gene_type:complete
MVKFGPCKKEDVDHLLRVQWMEIGRWELDQRKLEELRRISPRNQAHKDKYTYVVMYKDPNNHLGEWICPEENRITQNGSQFAFRYNKLFYTPKEEMADAYALFVLAKESFEKQAGKNKVIESKYEFIREQFS